MHIPSLSSVSISPSSPTPVSSSGTKPSSDLILSQLLLSAVKHRGTFNGSNIQWAYGNESSNGSVTAFVNNYTQWSTVNVMVTDDGKILTGNSLLITANLHECILLMFDFDTIVKLAIKGSKKSLFFRFADYNDYIDFVGAASVWANLKQYGRLNKWAYTPSTNKNTETLTANVHFLESSEDSLRWVSATAQLHPSGTLVLSDPLKDNRLIHSYNISSLFESEVRFLHSSVFQKPHTVYIGPIKELRDSHQLNYTIPFIENPGSSEISNLILRFEDDTEMKNWYINLLTYTNLELLATGRHHLRICKDVSLEILDLQATSGNFEIVKGSYMYCELIIWNKVWFRTSIVKTDCQLNIFWKDLVNIKLPVSSTNNFKLLIRKASSSTVYNQDGDDSDEIVGFCMIHFNMLESIDIHRIKVTNVRNQVVGELMISLNVNETKILPVEKYTSFAKMISTSKISLLISEIEPKIHSSNLEYWSTLLLDIYLEMDRVDEFFETIMKEELTPSSINESAKQTSFKYTTIFRGNSILSKSLEKYTIKVGGNYLKKLLGEFIDKIAAENLSCECDPKVEPGSYSHNYKNLLTYVESLWKRIKLTTNDIPTSVKTQWKNLRSNVELSVDGDYIDVSLNALSSFIFLRFICPAIMSPKLYNVTDTHYAGNVPRTLVLIAKVFMTFSNRGSFQAHKDPYLVSLNHDFIDKHQDELLTYFDKVTSRRLDFNEKILNLGEEEYSNKRLKGVNPELPSLPYLIDQYANFAKLSEKLLEEQEEDKEDKEANSVVSSEFEIDLDLESYQISDIDVTRLDSDFLSSIIEEKNEAFDSVLSKHEFTIKDIKKQARRLITEVNDIESLLEKPQLISDYGDKASEFIDTIIRGFKIESLLTNYKVVFDTSGMDGDHRYENDNIVFFEKVKSESSKRRNRKGLIKKPSVSSLKELNTSDASSECSNNKRSFIKNIFRR